MIRVVIPEDPMATKVWVGDFDLTEACPISKIDVTLCGGPERPRLRLEFEVFEADVTIHEAEVVARFRKIFKDTHGEFPFLEYSGYKK